MRSLLRFWFVWLMVLAVPLQGMAGSAMQHCAKAPQQSQHRSTADAAHADHAQAHAPAHAQAHAPTQPPTQAPIQAHAGADHAHGHGAAADPTGAVAAEPAAAHAVDGDHQCSACAACCSALGLPSRATPLAAPAIASATPPLPRVAVDSFVPAGLDRPPRSGLG